MGILVTGATGFLGTYLLESLAADSIPIRALCRGAVPEHYSARVLRNVDWVPGDLNDIPSLEDALMDIDQVFNVAGKVSFACGEQSILHKVNVEGTANLVNCCLDQGIRKLVHVSSVVAIGRAENGSWIREEDRWEENPNNTPYARSKYLGEMEVWRGIAEGLPALIVNPTVILGKGFGPGGSPAIFSMIQGGFPFYSEGTNGFVDVLDVVKALRLLMEYPAEGQRFILNGANWTYRKLFTEIARNFNQAPPSRCLRPWMGEIYWRWESLKALMGSKGQPLVSRETARTAQLSVGYDNSRILKLFPEFSFHNLEETIRRTCSQITMAPQAVPET